MKTLKSLILILILLVATKISAQPISNSWYSEKNNICIKFDSTDNSVKINEFYDSNVHSSKRIFYKQIGNKIKLTWLANQTLFGWQKDIYWLIIDEHKNNVLTLTLLPNKHLILDEIFNDKTNKFLLTLNGCDEKWNRKNDK